MRVEKTIFVNVEQRLKINLYITIINHNRKYSYYNESLTSICLRHTRLIYGTTVLHITSLLDQVSIRNRTLNKKRGDIWLIKNKIKR